VRTSELIIVLLLMELAAVVAMALPWGVWRHVVGIAGTVLLLHGVRWIFWMLRRALTSS